MSFITQVDGEFIRGTVNFRLTKDLIYNRLKTNETITVPAGFITNFASIPKFLLWYIDTDAPEIRDAAVVHDYLYVNKLKTRVVCDNILAEAMLDLNSGKTKSTVAWLGVRLGGWLHFGKAIV